MVTKKNIAAKENNNEIMSLQQQMMNDAEKQLSEATTGGTSNTLSTRAKRFSLGDLDLGNELSAVILDSVFENTYYDRAYSQDEAVPPACFAINPVSGDMAPHEDSPAPQADTCAECPMNEWESAATGKGKACANKRRLALYAYDDDGMQTEEMVQIRISPTGLKRYNAYVKNVVAKLGRPSYGVVTKLAFDEKQSYPTLTFECEKPISDEEIQQVFDSRKLVEAMLSEGYDTTSYEPQKVRPTRKKSKMS